MHTAHRTDSLRPVDEILRRHHARLREVDRMLPPDFVHGDARLDEVYDVFGEVWVEQAVFLERFDENTFVVAWFDDWFLTVRRVTGAAPEAWIAQHLPHRRSIVELVLGDRPEVPARAGHVVIATPRWRLLEFERDVLAVTRESFGASPATDAQNDLLSLVCLCARLGR